MKIAYYLEWSEGPESGVFKKVATQIKCWHQAGLDVSLYILSNRDTLVEWQNALGENASIKQQCWQNRAYRFWAMRGLVRNMLSWQPDLVYKRDGPYYPVYERIFRQTRLVLEINTITQVEGRLNSLHRYWHRRLADGIQRRKIDGLVFVSYQVSKEDPFSRFGKLQTVIPNGIDLSSYDVLPAPKNPTPRLAFMGSPGQPWHGLEKVVFLARQFPSWQFDLIGPKKGALGPDTPVNVHEHGRMVRAQYQEILSNADVAISSLALHKVGIRENSPLKLLEYLAFGIPAIVGYRDSNFLSGSDFLLELPSTPDNVSAHLQEIEDFITRVIGTRVPRAAICHIDSLEKERERVAFFSQVLQL